MTPTRRGFNRFFAAKYLRLLKAAFIPAEKRPDYRDPSVIAGIASAYESLQSAPGATPEPVPKNIFMLWQQGWEAAPTIVRACAQSWQDHNPGWKIHLLDDKSLPGHAPSFDAGLAQKAGRPARANLARLALLAEHGGVWADATLFCTRPLDDWLPAAAATGLFMFSQPRPYRYVDIWFMAAQSGSPTIAGWQDLAHNYWQLFSRPHHYYWMEYLYEFLCARDPYAALQWNNMQKLSALGPLAVGGNPFDKNAPRAIFDLIGENRIPAHKLSHKFRFAGQLEGTPLGALTGLEKL